MLVRNHCALASFFHFLDSLTVSSSVLLLNYVVISQPIVVPVTDAYPHLQFITHLGSAEDKTTILSLYLCSMDS